jgi:hypothetical protein
MAYSNRTTAKLRSMVELVNALDSVSLKKKYGCLGSTEHNAWVASCVLYSGYDKNSDLARGLPIPTSS